MHEQRLARPVTPGRPRRQKRYGGFASTGLLAIPAIAWFAVFMVGPLLALFYYALLNWPGLLAPKAFVGLSNFVALAHDSVFWEAARNSAIQVVVVVPITIVLSFMLGYYLQLMPRGHRIIRIALFTPILLSTSAQAMVFTGILSPTGLVDASLEAVGLGNLARPWLASGGSALACILIVGTWSAISLSTLIFTTRLSAVPPEVYEAAELDGCGHWRKMWRIAGPICSEMVGVISMLQFLWVLFGSATLILLLTKGGPGTSTSTLAFLMYSLSFNRSEVGMGQAVAVVLFVVGVIGMLIIRAVFRRRD